MTLHIPEETLREAGLTERDALIEFACRLFDAQKLNIHQAAKLAALDRYTFEAELIKRQLPIHRYSKADLRQDLEAVEKLGSQRR